MSAAVLLGLGAAIGYGLGDFLGGLYSRRFGILRVLVVGQTAGLLVLLAALPVWTPAEVGLADLAWGAAAGVAGVVGGVWLLRGFRTGRLSVVSPVSSLGTAGIPLLVDLALGARPSMAALSGMGMGLLALWLVGTGAPDVGPAGRAAAGLGYGLASGVCFAALYLALSRADPASGIWPVVASQVAVVAIAAGVAVWRRQLPYIPVPALPGVAATGAAVAVATVSFLLAARAGLVSVAALIASLSPAFTVLLARLVLSEQLPGRQVAGLLLAGVALVLIGLG